jgi:hypothetical protein
MPLNIQIDTSHWANVGCVGWWPVLPQVNYGNMLPAVIGAYDFTIVNVTGTHAGGPWAVAGPSTAPVRPGSMSSVLLGPFMDSGGTYKYYGSLVPNVYQMCGSQGTFGMWIYPIATSATFQELVSSGASTTSGVFDYQTGYSSQTGLYTGMYVNAEDRVGVASILTVGTWQYVMCTWAVNDKSRMYKNGLLVATGSGTIASYSGMTGNTFLGSTSWQSASNFSQCYHDDPCFWNRQFSAQECWQAYVDSLNGWKGRTLSWPVWQHVGQPANAYSVSATGGMAQGGYPVRTSVWIMPGTGGMSDGGHEAPTLAFGPAASGGMTDGGDTAAPLAWDAFTGTSGTLLTAHKSNDGGTWTKHPSYSTGDARLNGSGQLTSNTSSYRGVFLHSFAPVSADYTVSADIVYSSASSSSNAGVCARWSNSANTGYYAHVDGNDASTVRVRLYKIVAGTETQLSSTFTASWSVGQTKRLSLRALGSQVSVLVDGSLAVGPVTDTSISSPGQAGVYIIGLYIYLDNWTPTGGGVQAQYVLSGSGGQEFGGAYGGGQLYVIPCSGGIRQGGYIAPAASFAPSVAGGMKDGGFAGPHLLITETVSGGMADGGTIPDGYVSFLATGGMATGGERQGPVMDYGPVISGGLTGGGSAPNIGVYLIEPSGGMQLGGTVDILVGLLYHVYANDGAGGPIDYDTVVATTNILSYTTDTLTGPAVWSFGVRAFDGDTHLEERNVDAVVTVRLDAAGRNITNIPAPVLALTGHASKAGKAVLSWQYQTTDPAKAPRQFNVYQGLAGGGGSVNYASPVATVPYRALLRVFQATVSGLTGGTTYQFSVRAANTTGEEQSTTTVIVRAETTGPSAVIGVSGSAVA